MAVLFAVTVEPFGGCLINYIVFQAGIGCFRTRPWITSSEVPAAGSVPTRPMMWRERVPRTSTDIPQLGTPFGYGPNLSLDKNKSCWKMAGEEQARAPSSRFGSLDAGHLRYDGRTETRTDRIKRGQGQHGHCHLDFGKQKLGISALKVWCTALVIVWE